MNVHIRTSTVIFFPSFDASSFLSSKLIDDAHVKTWFEPKLHKMGKQRIKYVHVLLLCLLYISVTDPVGLQGRSNISSMLFGATTVETIVSM